MNDILYESATRYSNLFTKGYHIVLGRKNKQYELQLRFTMDSFYHLIGLQHLTDITFPSKNRERIFKDILTKKITLNMLQKSIFFNQYFIEERIIYLSRLEEMLDSCQILFLINHKEYIKYTRIHADYLCEYRLPDDSTQILYYFMYVASRPRILNECGGCSFFKKHNIDFKRGTAEAKLLLNEKIVFPDTPSQTVTELFRHKSYIPANQ